MSERPPQELAFGPVSLVRAALLCRCPRCGEGRIFTGLLSVRAACPACGLDLSAEDAGDGPAVFLILLLGAIAVGLAAWVEIEFSPPIWVHLIVLTPVIVGGAIGLLRPMKAGMIALQYRHNLLNSAQNIELAFHELGIAGLGGSIMTGFHPRLVPTLFTVPGVLILLALGIWQVQRLHWKEGLIAQRDAAVAVAPIAPPPTLAEARADEFHHVVAEGVFLNNNELFLAASSEGGGSGYQVMTPLRMTDGRTIFVNRGFIPLELKDKATRVAGEPTGNLRIAGLIRVPPAEKPSFFLPDNRPDLNLWFWVDLPAMAKAAGIADPVPFYIDADKTPNPGGWPQGGVTRLDLPNDHLQYAITWFALAVALIVIYVLYHRGIPPPGD